MSKVITIVSTKGSVGKTSLAIHIGGYLAAQGKKVLFIDADSQQSLSKWFDYIDLEPDSPGFGNWFMDISPTESVIYKTANHQNIDIIINDDPNKLRVSKFLRESAGAVLKLATMLKPLRERYDYIFIDTEGTDGRDHAGCSIQDTAILCEPDLILSVTKSKFQFASEISRVALVYREVVKSYAYIGKTNRPPLKFIVNEYDRNLKATDQVMQLIYELFAQDDALKEAELLQTIIPFKKRFFEEEHNKNKTFMHDYEDPNVHDRLNLVIRDLCQEIFPELINGEV